MKDARCKTRDERWEMELEAHDLSRSDNKLFVGWELEIGNRSRRPMTCRVATSNFPMVGCEVAGTGDQGNVIR